jgi:hypothetical protein
VPSKINTPLRDASEVFNLQTPDAHISSVPASIIRYRGYSAVTCNGLVSLESWLGCNEFTTEEEKGLAGVFGFLSPGAHRPVGIPEGQMTLLGRSFALNMCWFLLKNHLVPR